MADSYDMSNMPNPNDNMDEASREVNDYLALAQQAVQAGRKGLALHLYLTAFEAGLQPDQGVNEDALNGLRRAWRLACDAHERSLAEHIFEKLSPYLNHRELAACSEQLQQLALGKLEEIGLSREDLEEMSQAISRGLMDFTGATEIHVGNIVGPIKIHRADNRLQIAPMRAEGKKPACECGDSCSCQEGEPPADAEENVMPDIAFEEAPLRYRDLHGYANAIKEARRLGIGRDKDPHYQDLVAQLNSYHGLDRAPSPDALVFQASVREDANQFLRATVGEMGLSGIRMQMEEGLQGAPVLCVYADKHNTLKYDARSATIAGSGVVVLENVDLWDLPPMEPAQEEGMAGFVMAQLSRGARDAIALIHAAVASPDVMVMASCAKDSQIEPFFLDLIEPFRVIQIDAPTPGERADIWLDITHTHPSMRSVDRAALVRYSANMPRFDMYMAAREAVEETYKEGLAQECYLPVAASTVFEKIAAYQPLDSAEYRALEEAIVEDFRNEFEHLDELLA